MCRRLTLSLIIAVAGMSLLGVSIAGAETYTIKGGENSEVNTKEFEEAVAKCNAAASATTIVLGSGSYLPPKTIIFTNTTEPCTIEGPSGTPTTATNEAIVSGAGIETLGSELLAVEPAVNLTLKNLGIASGGGEGAPAIEIAGFNEKTKTAGGILNVENSLLTNTGASINTQTGATLTVRNSTISNGSAEGVINNGKTTIINSTVAYNKSNGIEALGESTTLTNSIVAENKGGDCTTHVTTSENSLDSDGSCGVGTLSKTNPLLNASLLNIGGATRVHPVKAGSPAINAGSKTTCLTEDQRHAPRPGITGDACTIGADEYDNAPPKVTVPSNISKTTETSEQTSLVVSYEASAVGVDDRVTSFSCTPPSGSAFVIGTTTVKCTAVDGHENTATGEFTVTIIQKKEEGLKEGHPQLFSNGLKVGLGSGSGVAQVGYGDIKLESSQLPGGFVECTNIGLGTGYNGGTPIRALGQILSWTAAGHAPNEVNKELSSECRGLGGGGWATDETHITPKSTLEATRGSTTTPWNVETECGTRAGEKVAIVRIGVPSVRTEAEVKAGRSSRLPHRSERKNGNRRRNQQKRIVLQSQPITRGVHLRAHRRPVDLAGTRLRGNSAGKDHLGRGQRARPEQVGIRRHQVGRTPVHVPGWLHSERHHIRDAQRAGLRISSADHR